MRIRTLLKRYGPELVGAACFACCTFSVSSLMKAFSPRDNGAMLVFSCFGVMAAAAALLAIWAVLGTRNFWLRLLLSSSTGLLLFALWFTGSVLTWSANRKYLSDEWAICAVALLCLPLVFLVIQLPLWLVRLVFRWEVALSSPLGERPNLGPLTLRDIFGAMGLIGLTLGLARYAQPLAEKYGSMSPERFWMGLGIMLATILGGSLVSTLPMLVATLATRKPLYGLLGISIYATAIPLIPLTVVNLLTERTPRTAELFYIYTIVGAFVAATTTTLLIARWRGFRLTWGRGLAGGLVTAAKQELGPREH